MMNNTAQYRTYRTTFAHVGNTKNIATVLPCWQGSRHESLRVVARCIECCQCGRHERVLRRYRPLFMGTGNRAQYKHSLFPVTVAIPQLLDN